MFKTKRSALKISQVIKGALSVKRIKVFDSPWKDINPSQVSSQQKSAYSLYQPHKDKKPHLITQPFKYSKFKRTVVWIQDLTDKSRDRNQKNCFVFLLLKIKRFLKDQTLRYMRTSLVIYGACACLRFL